MKPDNLEAILTTARKMFCPIRSQEDKPGRDRPTARVAKGTIYNISGAKTRCTVGVLRGEAEEIVETYCRPWKRWLRRKRSWPPSCARISLYAAGDQHPEPGPGGNREIPAGSRGHPERIF